MAARWVTGFLVVCLVASSAHADDAPTIPGHTVERPIDGGIVLGAVAIAALAKLVPARDHSVLWTKELLDIDLRVRENFSPRAAHLSDGMLALSVLGPAIYLTGATVDDVDGDRLLLYGETMAIDIALASIAKQIVQRPRPYMYSKDPKVIAYAKAQGLDRYAAFYSGHSAISFGAAMAGAYLLGASNESVAVRNVAFGVGFGIAATTASLRVRAGKHYISDVLIGSLVGLAVGYGVPALHAETTPYKPTGSELSIAAASVVGGVLLGQLVPLGDRHASEQAASPLAQRERATKFWQLTPTAVDKGMGFGVVGGW